MSKTTKDNERKWEEAIKSIKKLGIENPTEELITALINLDSENIIYSDKIF